MEGVNRCLEQANDPACPTESTGCLTSSERNAPPAHPADRTDRGRHGRAAPTTLRRAFCAQHRAQPSPYGQLAPPRGHVRRRQRWQVGLTRPVGRRSRLCSQRKWVPARVGTTDRLGRPSFRGRAAQQQQGWTVAHALSDHRRTSFGRSVGNCLQSTAGGMTRKLLVDRGNPRRSPRDG